MKLAYHNVLAEETISVSTEATGFEKENAYDNRMGDYWKPTAVPAWLKATGKMPVGMWMGDTTAETLVGSELITDGDMPATTNWTASNATLSIVGGKLRVTCVADGNFGASQIPTAPTSGDDILLAYEYDCISMTGTMFVNIVGLTQQAHLPAESGTNVTTYTSTGGGTLSFIGSSLSLAGDYFEIDNVTLRLAVPDLTTNLNGLGVYGSITKSGANLMAYSGFSASNYLEQPYNSDLDVGTGDFAYHFSFNRAAGISTTEYFYNRNDIGGGGPQTYAQMTSTGVITFYIAGSSVSTTTTYDDGEDHSLWVIRASGVAYIYVDGALIASAAATGSVTNITSKLFIGVRYSLTLPFGGSLSLVKATATPPTAAEILTIYNQEKHYFKTGGTLPETLISTSATTADYFAMYDHDYAQTGASVVLQYSDDDSTWTNAFDPIFPATSKPIFKTFTQSSHKYWRIYVDGVIKSIGIMMFGKRLDFANGLTFGFAPPALAQQNQPKNNVSPTGNFIGRTVEAKPIRSSLVFNPTFAAPWVRQYWPDLIRHMENKPFFVLPEDGHPDEAVFCWADNIPAPAYASTFMKLDIPIMAKVA